MGLDLSAILDSIEIIVDEKIKNAGYDKTIIAIIKSCTNLANNVYRVRYQDSEFSAVCWDDKRDYYNEGEYVYVVLPSQDDNLTKYILGPVSSTVEESIRVESSPLNRYNSFGDIYYGAGGDPDQPSVLTGPAHTISLSTNATAEDLSNLNKGFKVSPYFICEFDVATDIHVDNRDELGNYGITFNFKYEKDSTNVVEAVDKEFQDVTIEPNTIREYTVDINKLLGNPYNYPNGSHQYVLFEVAEPDKFISIESAEAWLRGFSEDTTVTLSNIKCYAAIEAVVDTYNYQINITSSNNKNVINTVDDNITLNATFTVDGKIYNSSQIKYYWFREDKNINTGSEYYNVYGGEGWHCLNKHIDIEILDSVKIFGWAAAARSININYQLAPLYKNIYKCVAIYEGDLYTSNTFTIVNNNTEYGYDITLTSKVRSISTLADISEDGDSYLITDLETDTPEKYRYAEETNYVQYGDRAYIQATVNPEQETYGFFWTYSDDLNEYDLSDAINEQSYVFINGMDMITDITVRCNLFIKVDESDYQYIGYQELVLHAVDKGLQRRIAAKVNVFNSLTNNGEYDGIFYVQRVVTENNQEVFNRIAADDLESVDPEDIRLYINATYIRTGVLEVGDTDNPVFRADIDDPTNVTIAGFHVTNKSIYSGNKNSIDSVTSGVYLGTDGLAIGNNTEYIKATPNGLKITGKITATSLELGNVKIPQNSVDGLVSDLADINKNIEDTNSNLDEYKETIQDELTDIDSTFGTINKTITGLSSTLENTNGDLEAAIERINTAEGNIVKIEDNILTINTNIDGINNTISAIKIPLTEVETVYYKYNNQTEEYESSEDNPNINENNYDYRITTTTTWDSQSKDGTKVVSQTIQSYLDNMILTNVGVGESTENHDKEYFYVSPNGLLEADNAIIHGTIYANAGQIGGFRLESNKLTSGSGSRYFGIDTDAGNTTPVLYLGNSNAFSAPFKVYSDGSFIASKATITGAITATSLSLGSTISIPQGNISGLENDLTQINNNIDDTKSELSNLSNSTTQQFDAIGSTISIIQNNINDIIKEGGVIDTAIGEIIIPTVELTYTYYKDGQDTGTKDDYDYYVVKTDYKLGNEIISSETIYSQNMVLTNVGLGNSNTSDTASGSNEDKYFKVDSDGLLIAKNAIIYGTIYANAGRIGGYTLSNNVLSSGSGSTYVELNASSDSNDNNSTYAIFAGAENGSSAPFSVTKSGTLIAKSGKIGDFYIGEGLYLGNITSIDNPVYYYRANQSIAAKEGVYIGPEGIHYRKRVDGDSYSTSMGIHYPVNQFWLSFPYTTETTTTPLAFQIQSGGVPENGTCKILGFDQDGLQILDGIQNNLVNNKRGQGLLLTPNAIKSIRYDASNIYLDTIMQTRWNNNTLTKIFENNNGSAYATPSSRESILNQISIVSGEDLIDIDSAYKINFGDIVMIFGKFGLQSSNKDAYISIKVSTNILTTPYYVSVTPEYMYENFDLGGYILPYGNSAYPGFQIQYKNSSFSNVSFLLIGYYKITS